MIKRLQNNMKLKSFWAAVLLWLTFAGVASANLGSGGLYGILEDLRGGGTVAGDLDPNADNTYDLGDASLAWKDLWLDGELRWPSATRVDGGTDGTVLLQNNAGTGFTGLQLGGTGASNAGIFVFNQNFLFKNASNTAYSFIDSGDIRLFNASNQRIFGFISSSAPNFRMDKDITFAWSNTSADINATKDIGFYRDSAGVLKISDGSTGFGQYKGNVVRGESTSATGNAPETCSASTRGMIIYVDDTDDSARAEICVCVATSDDGAGTPSAYSWQLISNVSVACDYD